MRRARCGDGPVGADVNEPDSVGMQKLHVRLKFASRLLWFATSAFTVYEALAGVKGERFLSGLVIARIGCWKYQTISNTTEDLITKTKL